VHVEVVGREAVLRHAARERTAFERVADAVERGPVLQAEVRRAVGVEPLAGGEVSARIVIVYPVAAVGLRDAGDAIGIGLLGVGEAGHVGTADRAGDVGDAVVDRVPTYSAGHGGHAIHLDRNGIYEGRAGFVPVERGHIAVRQRADQLAGVATDRNEAGCIVHSKGRCFKAGMRGSAGTLE